MKPTFFKTPAEMRQWFERHHESKPELLVGFYKVGSGKPSVTWPQAVDEALCFGWIDGVRHSLGDDAYTIRFTPRRAKSYWSTVNIKKAQALLAGGRMHAKGIAAFEARDAAGHRNYSFEKDATELDAAHLAKLQENTAAAEFHAARPASYRRAAHHWIGSAKSEETRLRRLRELIDSAARGETVRHLTPRAKRKAGAEQKTAERKTVAKKAAASKVKRPGKK